MEQHQQPTTSTPWKWVSVSWDRVSFILILILSIYMAILLPSATSLSLSDDQHVYPGLSTARTLLQAQKDCPVNFENLNYTVITSRCKGPKYPAQVCCDAFKDFACPYSDELDDEDNNCANTMFSYINLYGKYPPGLFANECRDSKRGLECSDSQSAQSTSAAAYNHPLLFLLSPVTFISLLLPFI